MGFFAMFALSALLPFVASAQNRVHVHDAFAGADYEERSLANGMKLAVSYTSGGQVSGFAISSAASSSCNVAKGVDHTTRPPIDEGQAGAGATPSN